MSKEYIVDRLEEEYVVCEDENKQMHDFLKTDFPVEVKAGDIVIHTGDSFVIDVQKTIKRTKKIKNLMASLWEEE